MNGIELEKAYNPRDFEDRIYAEWNGRGYFKPRSDGDSPVHGDNGACRDTYAVVIPPPNVTGVLHMGHGLNNTLQDIVVRYHRMKGDDTLWLPGTDHAGIATQNVVERRLKKEARRKAKEAEEEDDEEEDVEEDEQKPVKESAETETEPEQDKTLTAAAASEEAAETEEDAMIIRDLEEEPEESTVVDTGHLKAAPMQEEKEEILEALGEAAPKKSVEEEEAEALERSLAEAVGELLNEEENETPSADITATAKEETENKDNNIKETTETDSEETEETEETEEIASAETEEPQEEPSEEEPIELAIPIHTAEELLKKAEEAGDHPEVIEDKETGVTILDYSDIL